MIMEKVGAGISCLHLVPVLLYICAPIVSLGQEQMQDVLYLKNGTIIRGDIIEQIPNQTIKIAASDGSLFVFLTSDIEKITKEKKMVQSVPKLFSTDAGTAMSIGIRAGLNLASMLPEPDLPTTSRTGLTVGGLVEIGLLSRSLVLLIEPTYTQKGAKFTTSSFGQEVTIILKSSYIEIPVSLKAEFGRAKLKPYIFAGPNLGLNLGAELQVQAGGQTQTYDTKDRTESIDFAIDLGSGLSYDIAAGTSMIVDIRYSLGLTDTDKNPGTSAKSRDIKTLIGVVFHL